MKKSVAFKEVSVMKIRYSIISLVLILAVCSLSQAATKVLEWKFDGDLTDASGNGINGTAYAYTGTTALSYTAGVSGQAIVSDGNQSSYTTSASTAVLPLLAADTWTVNFWVCPTTNPIRNWGLAYCLGNRPNSYDGFAAGTSRAIYSQTNNITFTEGPDNGGGGKYVSTGIPFDVGQWQMITTTYDGMRVRIYKNGLLIGSRDDVVFADAPGEVRVPAYAWGGYNFLAGKYDEFTVWRGAMTRDEILDMIIPGVLPEVELFDEVVYYTMDDPVDGTIQKMPDHSGKVYDGNLYGYSTPSTDWVEAGKKGGSLVFEGGQAVDLPVGVSVSQYAQYSVAFWFKSGYQPYNTAFYSEKATGVGSSFVIRGDAGDTGAIRIYSKDASYNSQYSLYYDASDYMDGDTWHHLAFTTDGNEARFYLDGEVVASCSGYNSCTKGAMSGSVGYSWEAQGFLGAWGETYVDEFHMYKGTLSQENILALMAEGNIDNDLDVDFVDFAQLAEQWFENTTGTAGTTYVADDMEGNITGWAVYPSSTYTGTGTINLTSNAYAGSGALQWNYSLPELAGGNYSSIVFDLGSAKDLSVYNAMKVYLYRHNGNTSEDLMYLKFIDASQNVIAEKWIEGPNSVILPVDEWDEWFINLDKKLATSGGSSYVDKTALTGIRYIMIGCGGTKSTARTGIIDIDDMKFVKYPTCSSFLTGDIDIADCKDCKVNMKDLATFTEDWLVGVE
ncbi:MAG: LamG domain-containing protein [Planctomycetaceae bacterium]|nr:LamG domain-containing protein [Planctomycetaceae bacterium]